jgi:hypothetical protein
MPSCASVVQPWLVHVVHRVASLRCTGCGDVLMGTGVAHPMMFHYWEVDRRVVQESFCCVHSSLATVLQRTSCTHDALGLTLHH